MVLGVAGLLFLQIFLILIFQLLLLLGGHDFKKTEWGSQILQVLLDQIQFVNVFIDIVVPVSQKLFKTCNIGVRKVAAQTKLRISLFADSLLVKILVGPDLLTLLAVIADCLIVQIQRLL